MKVKVLGILLVCILATGCIESNTVIKVKTDGSGTIEETAMMSKAFAEQMKAMMGAFGQQAPGDSGGAEFDLFNEADFKEKVSDFGEGVTYLSGEKISTDQKEGFKAIYAFTDISKVKIKPNQEESMPSGLPGMEMDEPEAKEEFFTFQFSKGNPATLSIIAPKSKNEEKPEMPEETPEFPEDDMGMAMMKSMLKDMKISITLEVDGTITDTNATYQEGSRVTLMEMDFNKVIENTEKFKKLSKKQPETLDEVKELVKDIDGIKIELNEKVEIKFK